MTQASRSYFVRNFPLLHDQMHAICEDLAQMTVVREETGCREVAPKETKVCSPNRRPAASPCLSIDCSELGHGVHTCL